MSEKKAISLPDTKPEIIKQHKAIARATIAVGESAMPLIAALIKHKAGSIAGKGSISKTLKISYTSFCSAKLANPFDIAKLFAARRILGVL